MPFLKQFPKKISAKLVDTMQVMPKSMSAHGACSLEEPQPKLSPAIRILAFLYSGLLNTKSGFGESSASYLTVTEVSSERSEW